MLENKTKNKPSNNMIFFNRTPQATNTNPNENMDLKRNAETPVSSGTRPALSRQRQGCETQQQPSVQLFGTRSYF